MSIDVKPNLGMIRSLPDIASPEYIPSPSLHEVLDEIQPFPPFSMLLGICEDGLPLLLNLADPHPGSILISSDNGFGNTYLFQTIITGAVLVNTPEEINVHIISPQLGEFSAVHYNDHFGVCFDPSQPQAEMLIEELVNLVQSRKSERRALPFHILGIDGLDILLNTMSANGQALLHWLLDNGPRVGVWILSTIETKFVRKPIKRILSGHNAQILGQIQSPAMESSISGQEDLNLNRLAPIGEAVVVSGDQSIRIWVPEMYEDD